MKTRLEQEGGGGGSEEAKKCACLKAAGSPANHQIIKQSEKSETGFGCRYRVAAAFRV